MAWACAGVSKSIAATSESIPTHTHDWNLRSARSRRENILSSQHLTTASTGRRTSSRASITTFTSTADSTTASGSFSTIGNFSCGHATSPQARWRLRPSTSRNATLMRRSFSTAATKSRPPSATAAPRCGCPTSTSGLPTRPICIRWRLRERGTGNGERPIPNPESRIPPSAPALAFAQSRGVTAKSGSTASRFSSRQST